MSWSCSLVMIDGVPTILPKGTGSVGYRHLYSAHQKCWQSPSKRVWSISPRHHARSASYLTYVLDYLYTTLLQVHVLSGNLGDNIWGSQQSSKTGGYCSITNSGLGRVANISDQYSAIHISSCICKYFHDYREFIELRLKADMRLKRAGNVGKCVFLIIFGNFEASGGCHSDLNKFSIIM